MAPGKASDSTHIFHLVALSLCVSLAVSSHCPDSSAVSPCVCEEADGDIGLVSCTGAIGLPRLTAVLRRELCGRTVRKFLLTDSDVEHLPSNLFLKTIVKDIQVSFTNISHFTRAGRSAFFGLERHLSSLSMRRCHLVDALQWQMLAELEHLSYLDLSRNRLTEVPRQWFRKPPPNLLSLILKGNRISKVEPGALSHMHKLIELDLSENEIVTLSRDVFPHPGNALLFLRLNDNFLETLSDNFFDEMLGLRRIYLDNNRLQNLPQRVWSPIWGELDHLNLDGNSFECGCDLHWIAKLQPPRHLYGECYFDLSQLLSSNPWTYSGDTPSTSSNILHPNETVVAFNVTRVKLRLLEEADFGLCTTDDSF